MTLELTILGCGSSAGVPRVGEGWGACDPNNPKNRRRRCSLLVTQYAGGRDGPATRILIDTSPDLREQMLREAVQRLDAVWFTHDHADHTHGIDDIRPFFLVQRHTIPMAADRRTMNMLERRFSYCFEDQHGYPAIASLHEIHPLRALSAKGAGGEIEALPIPVQHGGIDALCFRFGDAAYMPDVNGLRPEAREALQGLDLLIIDALRRKPHPSHYSLSESLAVIADLKPARAVLTNLHIDLDYDTLVKELPPNVTPAFDGMKFDANASG